MEMIYDNKLEGWQCSDFKIWTYYTVFNVRLCLRRCCFCKQKNYSRMQKNNFKTEIKCQLAQ
jgi:hypothetical protein